MFRNHILKLIALMITIVLLYSTFNLPSAYAKFDKKRMYITNLVIPAAIAGFRAHYEGTSIKKAVLQALLGGYIMQEGFKCAAKMEEENTLYAWRTKLMINLGASICESAGYDKFKFRMDVGPVWLVTEDRKLKVKLGINSVIAPIIQLADGSKFDAKNSLKYGTFVFKRGRHADGTLKGSNALAYSQANLFVTGSDGRHSGHEMIHTYQYRRNAIYPIQISNVWPEFTLKYFKPDKWVDDTGWFVNWMLQCGWADWRNKNKEFDIPLEQEAYYMEKRHRVIK